MSDNNALILDLSLVPNKRNTTQEIYNQVAHKNLVLDYSEVSRYSKYDLWDASFVQQNSLVQAAIAKDASTNIGMLADHQRKRGGLRKLSYYDVRHISKSKRNCFNKLMNDLFKDYYSCVLHRYSVGTSERLFGILDDNKFIVLLFDANHLLIPKMNASQCKNVTHCLSCHFYNSTPTSAGNVTSRI